MRHPSARSFQGLGFVGGALLVIALLGSQRLMPSAIAQPNPAPSTPPSSNSVESSPSAIALARHLKTIGAKMYGAYWCPHCAEQRRLFGRTAFNLYINYIECAKDGYHAQPQVCKAEKIEGYPTWVINGKTYLGTQSLEELANASGYQGIRNF